MFLDRQGVAMALACFAQKSKSPRMKYGFFKSSLLDF